MGYKTIPNTMIRELAEISVDKLNWFPDKHRVSSYYSPQALITQKVLDYNKQCKHEFREYVQAHHQNTKTHDMKERTIDAIYLRANDNEQGGHIVMNLNTGEKITRGKVTAVPLSETVKNRVEDMAREQKITHVKFTNKAGVQLPKTDWIAGVDYNDTYVGIYNEREEAEDANYVALQRIQDEALIVDDDIDDDEIRDLLADDEDERQ